MADSSKLLRFHAIRTILGGEKSILRWEAKEALTAVRLNSDVTKNAKPSSRRCLYLRLSVLAFCRFSGLYYTIFSAATIAKYHNI